MYRNNKWFYIIDFIVIVLIFVCFINSRNAEIDSFSVVTNNYTLKSYLKSNYLVSKVDEKSLESNNSIEIKASESNDTMSLEDKKNIKKDETVVNNKNNSIPKKETVIETPKNTVDNVKKETVPVQKQEKVLEKLKGALAGYGPDCYGCTSFRTATGKYIGDGNIYYEDKEYGKVRIVAGDKSYPFGTIVKINNAFSGKDSTIYAIVLDRGGGVGKGKKFLFDLLFETEKAASLAGSKQNVDFEILRLGY